MASVALFSDECIQIAQSVKSGKTDFAIFVLQHESFHLHFSTPKDTQKEERRTCEEKWQTFLAHLPAGQCAYGFVNFSYISPSDNVERAKVVFVYWAPGNSKMKEKMVSAFSSNGILNKIGEGGISSRVEAGSLSSLDYDDVMQHVLAKATVK